MQPIALTCVPCQPACDPAYTEGHPGGPDATHIVVPPPGCLLAFIAGVLTVSTAAQQQMQPTPDRRQGEGDGPYDRLVIRGATVIDGTGAPPRGPVDIVVAQDRITEIPSVGYPEGRRSTIAAVRRRARRKSTPPACT